MNKDNQNIANTSSKRKASTLSTSISQTDTFSDSNSLFPTNNIKPIISQNNDRNTSFTQKEHVFFGRDRLNSTPITAYYEGMDYYLRGLQPEKNNYQNTNILYFILCLFILSRKFYFFCFLSRSYS